MKTLNIILKRNKFHHFVFRERSNQIYLLIALAATIIQFIIFKLLYPFPDFSGDAHNYIYAASANLNISICPIGYSKFLSVFHHITYSPTALVCFQYILIEMAAFYFFFTFCYLYRPSKSTVNILFIFFLFNPLFLYIGNYISNDPLFLAISLLWFTQLLWIVHSPKYSQIFTQAILLFICITLSNVAYYYPFISIIAFLLSRQRIWVKLTGIMSPFVLIIPFILLTRNEAYKLTGTKQFSLSAGWQLANNAIYIFEYTDSVHFNSIQSQEIDKRVRNFYNWAPRNVYEQLSSYPGDYFIRDSASPLKQYFFSHYKISSDSGKTISYGKASSIFRNYGSYQIEHNPAAYFWEFMLPNTKHYFLPHLERLKIYTQGQEHMDTMMQKWFAYKDTKITAFSTSLQGILLFVFPVFFLAINIFLLGSGAWLLAKRKFQQAGVEFNRSIIMTGSFLLINFSFSVLVAIIIFRQQIFPMIVGFTISLLLIELMEEKAIQSNGIEKGTITKKEDTRLIVEPSPSVTQN